jgi:alkanesulfonate monooxygenase SsuD/methylene tetrahydromethanopterin reductase-like flavin-dependent oxidoreductase (luciferase family)
MKIRFGVIVPQEGEQYENIKNIALKAEEFGFNSFWLNDHVYLSKQAWPDCLATLAGLCEVTKSIKLGTLVLSNTFRYPSVLAKTIATLDIISKGRIIFGIGAGWHREEHIAYGISFPSFPSSYTRIKMLKEAVKLIKRMWMEKETTFKGLFYSVNKAVCNPKPVQKPHPPILIGGCGDHLLKVVAEEANMCNFGGPLAPPGSPSDFIYVLKNFNINVAK